jgi:hypothetical protein
LEGSHLTTEPVPRISVDALGDIQRRTEAIVRDLVEGDGGLTADQVLEEAAELATVAKFHADRATLPA